MVKKFKEDVITDKNKKHTDSTDENVNKNHTLAEISIPDSNLYQLN